MSEDGILYYRVYRGYSTGPWLESKDEGYCMRCKRLFARAPGYGPMLCPSCATGWKIVPQP